MKIFMIITLNSFIALQLFGEGIGTRGTGVGTRGTGIGTRGTTLQRDTSGFGIRGTSANDPATANDFLDLQLSELGSVPFKKIFQKNALVLKILVSRYLGTKQKSFENNPSASNLAPLNFEDWATVNAGSLIDLFESTQWELKTDSEFIGAEIFFEAKQELNMIEVSSSPQGLGQALKGGMITKCLSEFFIYAGAPFSYDEIYFQLLPIEKEIMNRSKSDFN